MKRSLLFAVLILGGCSWYTPHYHGPVLEQDHWLDACPRGKACTLATWKIPRDGFPPDYSSAEWHCPAGYSYASWIGMSDTKIEDSQIPILCVKPVAPGHDPQHPTLTPLGKATCKVGIEWLFNFGWPTPKNCKNEQIGKPPVERLPQKKGGGK